MKNIGNVIGMKMNAFITLGILSILSIILSVVLFILSSDFPFVIIFNMTRNHGIIVAFAIPMIDNIMQKIIIFDNSPFLFREYTQPQALAR